jgi:uncharacterized protein YlaI
VACYRCGAALSLDEIAVHKKLVNRGATMFLCKSCLAEEFKVSVELIEERIAYFKKTGCQLFVQDEMQ